MKKKLLTFLVVLCSAFATLGITSCGFGDSNLNSGWEPPHQAEYTVELNTSKFNPIVVYNGDFKYQDLTVVYTSTNSNGSFYQTEVMVGPSMVKSGLDTSTPGPKQLVIEYAGKTVVLDYTVKYQVNFVTMEGTSSQYVLDASEVVLPQDPPNPEGYTFAYWDSELPAVLTDNVTITAHYYENALKAPALETVVTAYDPNATLADIQSQLPSNESGRWAFVDATLPVGAVGSYKQEVTFLPVGPHVTPVENATVEIQVVKKQLQSPTFETELVYTGTLQKPGVIHHEEEQLYTLVNEGGVNAGEYEAIATLNDPANYEWTTGSVEPVVCTYEIAPKTITFEVEEGTYVYNGQPQFPTYTLSEEVSHTVDIDPQTNAGTYSYTIEVTDPNYAGSYQGKYTIEVKEVEFVVDAEKFVYDGEEHYPTYSFKDPEDAPAVERISGRDETEVGVYEYGWFVMDANYTGMHFGTFEIEKANVTVTALGAEIVYPASIPEIDYTVEGFDNEEVLNISIVGKPASSLVGTYTLTPVVNNPNVNATCVSATLVIHQGDPSIILPTLSTDGASGTAAIYHDKISTVTFANEGFGKWAWKDPDLVIDKMDAFSAVAVYTPQDPNLQSIEHTFTITNEYRKIARRPLTIVISQDRVHTYTGDEYSLEYTIVDERDPSYVIDTTKLTVSGNDAESVAGNHSRTLSLTSDYYVANNATANLVINKATPNVTLDEVSATLKYTPDLTLANSGIVLDGTALRPNDDENVPGTYAWVNSAYTLYNLAIDTPTAVDVRFTPEDTSNYNSVTLSFTVTVEKAATEVRKVEGNNKVELDLVNGYSKDFDNTKFLFTASVDRTNDTPDSALIKYTYKNKSTGVESAEAIDAGEYTLTIEIPATIHYVGATATVNVTIGQAPNFWTDANGRNEKDPWMDTSSWTYKNIASAIYTYAKWGQNTVQISYKNTTTGTEYSYAEYQGKLPQDAEAGSYTVSVLLPETSNWKGLTYDKLTFTIYKAPVDRPTVIFPNTENLTSAYTGSAQKPTVNGTYTDGEIKGAAYTLKYENENSTNFGTYSLTVTLNDTVNYQWSGGGDVVTYSYSITTAKNVVMLSIHDWNYGKYDEKVHTPETQATFATDVTCSYYKTADDAVAGTNAVTLEWLKSEAPIGTYYVRADFAADANNNFAAAYTYVSFKINSADYENDPFDDPMKYTWSNDGVVVTWSNGLTLKDVALKSGYTWDAPDTVLEAGTAQQYSATYKEANYNSKQGLITVTVNKRTSSINENANNTIYVSAGNYEYTYNGTAYTLTAGENDALVTLLGLSSNHGEHVTQTNGGVADESAWSFEISYNGASTDTVKNAGTYTIKVKLAESEHYLATDLTLTLTIKKVVKADGVNNMTATYGDTLADAKAGANSLSFFNDAFGSWSWDDGETTAVGDVGVNKPFNATYTPDDTVNYEGKTVTVYITVSQKSIIRPTITADLTYTGSLQYASVTHNDKEENQVYTVTDNGGVNVGTYTVTVTLGSNYKWSNIGEANEYTVNYDIKKATLTVEATTAQEAIYGDKVVDTLTLPKATFNGETIGTWSWKDVTADTTVGAFGTREFIAVCTLTGDDAKNFKAVSDVTITVTVAKASASIIVAEKTYEKTYDTNEFAFAEGDITASHSESPVLTYSYQDADGNPVDSMINAGTYTVVITLAESANYNGDSKTIAVTINQAAGEILNFFPSYNLNYTGKAAAIEAKANHDESPEIKYSYSDNGIVDGLPVQAGVYTVTVTLTETANYTGAVATASVSIAKVNNGWSGEKPTMETTWVYGTTGHELAAADIQAALLSGTELPVTVTYEYATNTLITYTNTIPADAPVGAYKVYIKVEANRNWEAFTDSSLSFTITKATATPSLDVDSFVYNGKAQAPTPSASCATVEGFNAYSVAFENANSTEFGEYKVTFTLTDTQNYKWATTDDASVTLTYNITQAENAIESLVFDGWIYTAAGNSLEPEATATFGTDTITYSYYKSQADADAKRNAIAKPVNVGTYYVRADVAEKANYKGASATADFTIANATFTDDEIAKIFAQTYTVTWFNGITIESSKIALPTGYGELGGSYAWTKAETSLDTIGVNECEATYTVANYNSVTGKFKVTVEKATATLTATMANSAKTFEFNVNKHIEQAAWFEFFAITTNNLDYADDEAKEKAVSYELISYNGGEAYDGTIYNAGTYVIKISLAASEHYEAPESIEVTIVVEKYKNRLTATNIPSMNATYEQNLSDLTAKLTENLAAHNVDGYWTWVDDAQSTGTVKGEKDGFNVRYIKFVPRNANYTAEELPVNIKVTAKKINAPVIEVESLIYNGDSQKATISVPETDAHYYEVVNVGGTEAGGYSVTVTLKDPANYDWQDIGANWKVSGEVLTYTYTIDNAENSWNIEPSISSSIVYSGSKPTYVGEALHGNDKLQVSFWKNGTEITKDEDFTVGNYTVKFYVPELNNYNELIEEIEFVITSDVETITWDPTAVYGTTLGDLASQIPKSIHGTWAWVKSADTKVGNVKETNTFDLKFTSTNPNYKDGTVVTIYVTVVQADAEITVNREDRNYTFTYQDTITFGAVANHSEATIEYSYVGTLTNGSDVSGNGLPTEAGEYTVTLSLAETNNYHAAADVEVQLIINKKQSAWVSGAPIFNGSSTWTYESTASTVVLPELNSGSALTSKITYKLEGAEGDGTTTMPVAAGTYNVTVEVIGDDNWISFTNENVLTYTVEKRVITLPTLTVNNGTTTSFVYNGTTRTTTLATSAFYTFTNVSGSDVGKYNVVLELNDASYKWSGNVDELLTRTLSFEIKKATNINLSNASISNWIYSEDNSTANAPSASVATFVGTNNIRFRYRTDGTEDVSTEIIPSTVGKYEVQAYVEGTTNYEGAASAWVDFEITQKEVGAGAITTLGTMVNTSYTYTGSKLFDLDELLSGTGYTVSVDAKTFSGSAIADGKSGVNAGTYKVTLSANDNYQLDTTYNTAGYTITINKALVTADISDATKSLTYNTEEQTAVVEIYCGETLLENGWKSITGNVQTNADTYDVTVVMGDNYTFTEGNNTTNAIATTKVLEFTVEKADCPTDAGTDLVYEAAEYPFYWREGIKVSDITITDSGYAWHTDVANTLVYPAANGQTFTAVYTHNGDGKNYKSKETMITFTLQHANVTITAVPNNTTLTYQEGNTYTAKTILATFTAYDMTNDAEMVTNLADAIVQSSISYTNMSNDTSTVTTIGAAGSYTIVYSLTSAAETTYEADDVTVNITVEQAKVVPATVTGSIGQKLSELTLPTSPYGTWSWGTMETGSYIDQTFEKKQINYIDAYFTPKAGYENDYAAYNTQITVDIGRTAVTPSITVTGEDYSGYYTGKNITITIGVSAGVHTLTGEEYTISCNGASASNTITVQDAKDYVIVLTITAEHAKDYLWTATDGTVSADGLVLTKTVTVAQAGNAINNDLTITGWTYGEAANAPSATATFGAPEFTYEVKGANGAWSTYSGDMATAGAGTYRVVATVEETTDYEDATDSKEFVIKQALATAEMADPTAELVYSGSAHDKTITVTGSVKEGDLTYKVEGNGMTNADKHTITVTLTNANYTFEEGENVATKTFEYTIQKAVVSAAITNNNPKYDSTELTANVALTVVKGEAAVPGFDLANETRTNAGSQDVTVTLTDTNYTFAVGEDKDSTTLTFTIATAINDFTTDLAIEDWIYGNTAKAPFAKATFGTVVYTYSEDGETYISTVPTAAGNYTVKATVAKSEVDGNVNYEAISATKSFTIAKATLTASITDRSFSYTASEIDVSENHNITVRSNSNQAIAVDEDYEFEGHKSTVVGNYTVTIHILNDNYVLAEQEALTYTITKINNGWANNATPTLSAAENMVYGKNVSASVDLPDLVSDSVDATAGLSAVVTYINNTTGNKYVGAELPATATAGNYTISIIAAGNNNWNDFEYENKFRFTIAKATIDKVEETESVSTTGTATEDAPIILQTSTSGGATTTYYAKEYNGEAQAPIQSTDDYTVTYSAQTSRSTLTSGDEGWIPTEAGTYKITITIKSDVFVNFQWLESLYGTGHWTKQGDDTLVGTYVIEAKKVAGADIEKLNALSSYTTTYDGTTHEMPTFVDTDNDGYTITLSAKTHTGMDIAETDLGKAAGIYTYTIKLDHSTNFVFAASVTVEGYAFTIYQAQVSTSATELTYKGSAYDYTAFNLKATATLAAGTVTLTENEDYTLGHGENTYKNAGKYTIEVLLSNPNYLFAANAYQQSKNVDVVINKAKVTAKIGNAATTVEFVDSGYSVDILVEDTLDNVYVAYRLSGTNLQGVTTTNDTATSVPVKNVDTYEYKIELVDTDNFVLTEGATLTFIIEQATNAWVDEPTISGGEYTGSAFEATTATAKFGSVDVTYYSVEGDVETALKEGKYPTTVGKYVVKFVGEVSDNYTQLTKTIEFTISKQKVTAPNVTGTADTPTSLGSYKNATYDLGIDADSRYTITVNGQLLNENEVEIKNAGRYEVVVALIDTANYQWNDASTAALTGTYVINKATHAPTVPTNLTATYGQTLKEVELSSDDFGAWTWSEYDVDTEFKEVGSKTFYAYYKLNETAALNYTTVPGYDVTTVEMELEIEVKPATVTLKAEGTLRATYTGIEFTDEELKQLINLNAYLEDRTPVSDIATYVAVSVKDAKDYKITCKLKEGVTNYTADTIEVTLVIEPAPATAYIDTAPLIYDGEKKEPIISILWNNDILNKDIDYTLSYQDEEGQPVAEPKDVGKYKVNFTSTNFTLSNPEILTFEITRATTNNVTAKLSKYEWTYGEGAATLTITADFGETYTVYVDETLVDSGSLTKGKVEKVTINNLPVSAKDSAYTVEVVVDGTDNYVEGSNTATYTIAKATLTAQLSTDSLTYNGKEQPITASVSGLVGNDTFTLTATNGADVDNVNHTVKVTNAGTYTVTFSASDNYTWKDNKNSFTITVEKIDDDFIISIPNTTLDGTNYTGTYSGDAFEASATAASGSTVTVTYSGENLGDDEYPTDAGTYTVTFSVAETSNYVGVEKSITITVKPQQIATPGQIADVVDYGTTVKVQDGEHYTMKIQPVNADSALGDSITEAVNAGTYRVTYTANKNYTFADGTTVTYEFTINQIKVTASLGENPTSEYNGQDQFSTVKNNLSFTAKDKTITLTEGTDYTVKVIEIKDVKAEGYTLTVNLLSSNYTLDANSNLTYTITKAENSLSDIKINGVEVTEKDGNYTYSGEYTGSAFEATAEATFGKDNMSKVYFEIKPTGNVELDEAPKTVGSYAVLIEIAGTDNYAKASATVYFTIAKQGVDISTLGLENKTVTYTGSSVLPEGLTNGDKYKVSISGGGINVGETKVTLTFSDIENAANYIWVVGKDENGTDKTDERTELCFTYTINKATVTATITIPTEGYTYTGSQIEPTVTVTWDGGTKELVLGTDYKVSGYGTNANATGEYYTLIIEDLNSNFQLDTVNSKLNYTINKATEEFDKNLLTQEATFGDALTVLQLPTSKLGTWNWEKDTEIGNAGKKTLYAVFKTDNTNYNSGDTTKVGVTVTVKPAPVSAVLDENCKLVYNGSEQEQVVIVNKANGELTSNNYTLSDNKQMNAGTYTLQITLENTNYAWDTTVMTVVNGNATMSFTIARKDNSYSGTVSFVNNQCVIPDLEYSGAISTYAGNELIDLGTANIGEYTITKIIVDGGDNYNDLTIEDLEIKVTISKKVVVPPTFEAKDLTFTYNGEVQHPIVEGSEDYTITYTNSIDANVGNEKYYVILTLTDSTNCYWSGYFDGSETYKIEYTITKATNSWTTTPSITGGTYNGNPYAGTATAAFGKVVITYKGRNNTTYESTTAPTDAGEYTAIFTVDETNNYTGFTGANAVSINFKIEKANITPTITVAAGPHYENQVVWADVVEATATGVNGQTDIDGDWSYDSLVFGTNGSGSGADSTFRAVFTSKNSNYNNATIENNKITLYDVAYIGKGSTTHYGSIENALAAAVSGDQVFVETRAIAKDNVRITADTTIPSNVTLILPYATDEYNAGGEASVAYKDPTVNNDNYCKTKVTLAAGKKLTVEGTLLIAGELAGGNGGQPYAGNVGGNYATLYLEGGAKVTTTSGALIDCYGFIKEVKDTTGSQVEIVNGATLWEPFVLRDFKGGSLMTAIISDYNKKSAPFNQFQIVNITAKTVVYYGGLLNAHCNLYADDHPNYAPGYMIGASGEYFIQLTNEFSRVEAKYDPSEDITDLHFYGGAKTNAMSLNAAGQTVSSTSFVLGLSWLYHITLDNAEGQSEAIYSMSQEYKLLPGNEFTIEQGASLEITTLTVYKTASAKGNEENGCYYDVHDTCKYPTNKADAKLIVNGKLKATNLGGLVQTTKAGAIVTVTGNTQVSTQEITSNATIFATGWQTIKTTYQLKFYSTSAVGNGSKTTVYRSVGDSWVGETEELNVNKYQFAYVAKDGDPAVSFDKNKVTYTPQTLQYDGSISLGFATYDTNAVQYLIFKGWNTKEDGTGETVRSLSWNDYVNGLGNSLGITPQTLYGIFEYSSTAYTVNFQDDSNIIDDFTIAITDQNYKLSNVSYAYEAVDNDSGQKKYFKGWSTDGTEGNILTSLTSANFTNDACTLYAVWGDKATITFNVGTGGSGLSIDTIYLKADQFATFGFDEHTKDITSYDSKTDKSQYFTGWENAGGDTVASLSGLSGDQTLTAQWEDKAYEIKFEPNDTDLKVGPVWLRDESELEAFSPSNYDAVMYGYDTDIFISKYFGGWYTDEGCTTAFEALTGSATLYAKWLTKHEIVLHANVGNLTNPTFKVDTWNEKSIWMIPASLSLFSAKEAYIDSIAALKEDITANYYFNYWGDASGTEIKLEASDQPGKTELYAQWLKKYTVTVSISGGNSAANTVPTLTVDNINNTTKTFTDGQSFYLSAGQSVNYEAAKVGYTINYYFGSYVKNGTVKVVDVNGDNTFTCPEKKGSITAANIEATGNENYSITLIRD